MNQIEKPWPYLSVKRADRQGTGEEALLRPPLLTAQGAACHIDTQQGQHGCLQQLLQVGVRDGSDKHVKKKKSTLNRTVWCQNPELRTTLVTMKYGLRVEIR